MFFVYLADSIKVGLGVGNSAIGSYCLVVTQANHCSEFIMPNCQLPIPKATFMNIESAIYKFLTTLVFRAEQHTVRPKSPIYTTKRDFEHSRLFHIGVSYLLAGASRQILYFKNSNYLTNSIDFCSAHYACMLLLLLLLQGQWMRRVHSRHLFLLL